MGIEHHRVTPEHPRANGEAESFMKVLNKTEQKAHNDVTSSSSAIQYMLMGYRYRPHPGTVFSPFEALINRNVRTKLNYETPTISQDYNCMKKEITFRDKQYKMKLDKQHRHLNVKNNNLR